MLHFEQWLNFEQWLLLITLLANTGFLGFFALVRTYYQRKGYKLQETMLKESREYWGSWKKRSEDISKRVEKDVEKKVFKILELKKNAENKEKAKQEEKRKS